MDFHTLTRRELQALCKKNKIPANITNVAMADALKSLEFVEGIEEIMMPSESQAENSSVESPEKSDVTSVPRTARRTANQKTAKKEPEMSQTTRTRRSTRRAPPQSLDEVKNEVIETPAAPTSRRRAATTSVRPKMENLLKECVDKEQDGEILNVKKDLPKTPGAALTSRRRQVKESSSVQQVYSTRRSARIAAKYEEESSKQDTEVLQTARYDEISEVNSKLYSLQWDDDMQQISENPSTKEIENVLTENYAVGLSDAKETNDVGVDLQQGSDLQLEGQGVVGDSIEVSKKLDDEDELEVPKTSEVSECVVELEVPKTSEVSECVVEHGDIQDVAECMVQPGELNTNEVSAYEVEESAQFKGQEEAGDDGETEYYISEELDTKSQEVVIGEVVLQPKQLDSKDIHDEEELDADEIFECEGGDADALCNDTNVVSNDMALVKQLHDAVTEETLNSESEANETLNEVLEVVSDDMALAEKLENGDEQLNYEEQNMNGEISEHVQDVSEVDVDGTEVEGVDDETSELLLNVSEVDAAKVESLNDETSEKLLDVSGVDATKVESMNDETSKGDVSQVDEDAAIVESVNDEASEKVLDVAEVDVDSAMVENKSDLIPEQSQDVSEVDVDGAKVEELVQEYESSAINTDVNAPISAVSEAETNSDQTFESSCLKPSNNTVPTEQQLIGKTNTGANLVTDDKENIDNRGINVVLKKEKLNKMNNAEVINPKAAFDNASLRQLKKLMKQLSIAEKSSKDVSRTALQQVSENRLVGESQKEL